ncbi:MAG: hypothetical protein KBS41_04025 [Oscillospiraceae bacterium]|nr:hypothetical protein [Candidatus Equicaccousia limihippi]
MLCSCAAAPKTVTPKTEFLLTATAEIDGTTYTADLEFRKDGKLTAKILSPQGLAGLCYTHRNGEGALSYNGLSLPVPDNPKIKSFSAFLGESLAAIQNGDTLTQNEDGAVYEKDGYTLYFNREGYPEKLCGRGVNAEFKIK